LRKQSFILHQVSITYRYLGSGRLFLLVDNLRVGRYETDVSSKEVIEVQVEIKTTRRQI